MRVTLLVCLLTAAWLHADTNMSREVAFNRILHGWTNYSTAFDTTHDLGPIGDYATIASFYTPTQEVCLLEYGAILIWSGSGGQQFSFTHFLFEVHVWSSLAAFTNAPRQGDVATYSFSAPTGGSTSLPDATTRGGRPAYELRFCLTNPPTTLTNGGTWLVGLIAKTVTK